MIKRLISRAARKTIVVLIFAYYTMLQTRNTSSQCYKGNGIDGVLEEDEAAQVTCHITDHSCTDTNHRNGDDEARVAIHQSCFVSSWEIQTDQLQCNYSYTFIRQKIERG